MWKFEGAIFLLLTFTTVLVKPYRGRQRGNVDMDFEYDFVNRKSIAPRLGTNPVSGSGDHTCPTEFVGRCICEYRIDNKYEPSPNSKYFVECKDSGFTTTSMLEYLPIITQVLVFTGNKIETLQANLFGKQNRTPNLKIIDMSNNGIREIDGKAFHHVEAVEILLLAHNELSNSSIHNHPRIFSNFYSLKDLYLTNTFNDEIWSFIDLGNIFAESNLTQLEKLHLGLNELTIIADPSAFCKLPNLRQLYIPQNQLTDEVQLNVTCLPNLEVIDLRMNKIRSITPQSNLWKLLSLTNARGEDIRVELVENPFNCDCNLQIFISWLKTEILKNPDRVRDNENLKCVMGNPSNNSHAYLREVESTYCDVLYVSSTASSVTTAVVWILSLICIFLLLTCAYFNRRSFFRKVNPLIRAATTGVQYTSIDKNETVEIAHV